MNDVHALVANAMRRCDRCTAAALETWTSHATYLPVRLCRHHGRVHELALHAQGFRITQAEKVPA